MKTLFVSFAIVLMCCAQAGADIVSVSITGQVIFNGINDPPLSGVNGGDFVEMSFLVDSNVFTDGIPGDTRGYDIIQSSFALNFDTPVSVGLADPFPGTPFFTLVDGFPVSDGFFVSSSPISPGGVPLSQSPFNANMELGYDGSTLSSLDILDAVGVYGFTGLTRFGFNLWAISPSNVAMEMDFSQMTITVIPEPTSAAILAPLGLFILARRRR